MDILKILEKIAKGEALTDEEKKFAGEYKPEGGEGRIPKERLDREIAKRNEAEKARAELDAKLAELQEKLEELQTAGMTEAEKAKAEAAKLTRKLQDQVETLTKERDEAAKKAADMEFRDSVREIARRHNFVDADYLGYKLRGAELKLDDADGVSKFMKNLEKESPAMFKSAAKPGAGTGAGANAPESANAKAKARLDELSKKVELSSREVAEVIELNAQMKQQEGGEKGKEPEAGAQTAQSAS